MKECSNCGISKNNKLENCPLCGMAMTYVPDDGSVSDTPAIRLTLTEIEKIRAFSKKKKKGWPYYGHNQ